MGDLSKNFSRAEFQCRDGCGFATVDVELIPILENVRMHFNSSIHITSGCRCKKYNTVIGGAKKSKHMEGRAADFQVKGVKPKQVQKYLKKKYKGKYGIGQYDLFTHVDTRANPVRWGKN